MRFGKIAPKTELAQRYANIIKNTIVKYKEQNSLKSVLIRLAELLLVLFIAFNTWYGLSTDCSIS